jgi:glycosyltransferase involved in cell wall biosynthesis
MLHKKILIINNGLESGGIQKSSVSLANYLAIIGYDIFLVALYKSNHFFSIYDKVHFVEPTFDRKKTNRYLYLLKIMIFLRKQIRKEAPDVILAFGEWTNSFVVLSNIGTKIPIFLSDRMSPILNLGRFQEFFKKKTYPLAKGIITQTSFSKSVLEKKIKAKNVNIIPNPVNSIKKIECTPKNCIITIGRLSKEKGHLYLIEAFSRIKNYNWELRIIGDGPERIFLENLVKQKKIENQVVFYGYQKNFSIQLSESQIFVLPSLSEGFPNALIEAMSLPIACISSDCTAGPKDIIKDGENGLLVQPGNIDDLANAMERLICDANLRKKIAEEAFKIRERLAFDKIAQQYLNFIFS